MSEVGSSSDRFEGKSEKSCQEKAGIVTGLKAKAEKLSRKRNLAKSSWNHVSL
ncbi:hypothetical protein [Mesobacillus jeotgali]|uniref:hypothetical protein n=1 Tax=Mesobacillus jeotgali TaxID=129985 RepID=UPI001CFED5BE|nr:hypothetical protein [Mesobacillus jeotgali]